MDAIGPTGNNQMWLRPVGSVAIHQNVNGRTESLGNGVVDTLIDAQENRHVG